MKQAHSAVCAATRGYSLLWNIDLVRLKGGSFLKLLFSIDIPVVYDIESPGRDARRVLRQCFYAGVASLYSGSSGQAQCEQARGLQRILQEFLISHMSLATSASTQPSQRAPLSAMQRAQICGACAAIAHLVKATFTTVPASLEEGLHVLR